MWGTPARSRQHEVLDRADVSGELRKRSHRDIALSNAVLGGSRALALALDIAFRRLDRRALTLLDVGSGAGATLRLAHRRAQRHGIALAGVGLDLNEQLAAGCAVTGGGVCGSALALPFTDRAFDVAVCSLLLHHFAGEELCLAVRELSRVTRGMVIVHDLRRSFVAAAGLWLASFPLAFHPVSRHDGVVSVLRGFTRGELTTLVRGSAGVDPVVTRRLGYRLVATWQPSHVR